MFVTAAIDLALDRLFSWEVPVELSSRIQVGQLLRLPFAGRVARGFAMALADEPPPGVARAKIRAVQAIEDDAPFFTPPVLELVKWIAAYVGAPIESCLRAAVPAAVLKENARPRELLYVAPAIPVAGGEGLTRRQAELLADVARLGGGWMQQLCQELGTTPATLRALALKGCLQIAPKARRRDPLAGRTVMPSRPLPLNPTQAAALKVVLASDRPVLLHGVTGSGKTEVYLQAIAALLERGQGAIVLVPEISLTPQTVRRFVSRFGERVAVLHSALSDGERYDEWHRIRRGQARVVVGPRSALFAPVRELGLIVVDEEHDGSYKQGETPRYHAREAAVMRAHFEGCRVVLGSATPSLESWLNAKKGKYALASMPDRVAGRSLPDVHLVDMAQEAERLGHAPIFSAPLLDAVRRRLDRGEQTILFLNRRGWSRTWTCADCGWVATCPDCLARSDEDETGAKGLPYVYHKADDCLRCHVCGGWVRVPTECPECHGRNFETVGVGTQRAEAALKACFPAARVLRMDADSTSRKFSHDDLLSAFRAGKADVLIGTQMIAKGLDFPNVTLVGVLNADVALNLPDPRASERTYQLLAQVAGRAGRAEKPGEVYIQTFQVDAPAIKAAAVSSYAAFADEELAARREGYFPPYCRLSTLLFKSKSEQTAGEWARMYAASLETWAQRFNAAGKGRFLVGEAAPAALAEAEGWFRWQIVLRTPSAKAVTAAMAWLRRCRPPPDNLRIVLDVDAIDLL